METDNRRASVAGRTGRRATFVSLGCVAALLVIAGCGGASPSQQQIGTQSGRKLVQFEKAVSPKTSVAPTLNGLVRLFNDWASGGYDFRALGLNVKGPSKPLSEQARRAAAAVALQYLRQAKDRSGAPINSGYLLAVKERGLAYRCKAYGKPPTAACRTSQWDTWQYGGH
jgi:hypothetical protein